MKKAVIKEVQGKDLTDEQIVSHVLMHPEQWEIICFYPKDYKYEVIREKTNCGNDDEIELTVWLKDVISIEKDGDVRGPQDWYVVFPTYDDDTYDVLDYEDVEDEESEGLW